MKFFYRSNLIRNPRNNFKDVLMVEVFDAMFDFFLKEPISSLYLVIYKFKLVIISITHTLISYTRKYKNFLHLPKNH